MQTVIRVTSLVLAALLFSTVASATILKLSGKNLKIQMAPGDDLDIDGNGGVGELSVSVNEGVAEEFSGVQNISVTGDDGAENVCVADDVEVEGSLKVKAGDGDDEIYVSGVFGKNVSIDLGDGDDTHYECDSSLFVGGNYKMKGGNGNDDFHWDQNIEVGKSMSIDSGAGVESNDDLIIHGSYDYEIAKTLKIKLAKDGGQTLTLENVMAGKLSASGGKGEDTYNDVGGNDFGSAKFKKIENGVPE